MPSPDLFFYVALALFPAAVLLAMWQLGPRRGVVASLLGGLLFLPVFDANFGVPLLRTKSMFVPGIVLASSLVFDRARWGRLRLRWFDLPLMVVVLGAFATAMANGLGAYEGASASFEAAMAIGAPYLLGRAYLGDGDGIDLFTDDLIVAGLVYAPLCLWEVRMSPQLHRTLYGYAPVATFLQNVRYGGFRPVVFMSHGLMVGMFMASVALIATWTWRALPPSRRSGLHDGWVVLLLVATTVLCKSTGAIALLGAGLLALEAAHRGRTAVLMLALAAAPPAYVLARTAGWGANELISASNELVNAERAQSIQFRLRNENLLMAKAAQRPWLGWGRWGRARIRDRAGREMAITDGMWIIELGQGGAVGLAAIWLLLGLPAALFLRSVPRTRWASAGIAPAVALAMVSVVGLVDDVFNAMMTPVFLLSAGALASLTVALAGARDRAVAHRRGDALVTFPPEPLRGQGA